MSQIHTYLTLKRTRLYNLKKQNEKTLRNFCKELLFNDRLLLVMTDYAINMEI